MLTSDRIQLHAGTGCVPEKPVFYLAARRTCLAQCLAALLMLAGAAAFGQSPPSQPAFSMSFAPSPVPLGGNATLTMVIVNNTTQAFTNIQFVIPLPSGVLTTTPLVANNSCGATISALPITLVNVSGISLNPANGQSFCSFSVNVIADANISGTATTGVIQSDQIANLGTASATITVHVPAALQVPAQYPTISAALAAAQNDIIAVAAGTYNELLTINQGVTITGATGNPADVQINGTGLTGSVVDVTAGNTVAISNVTIENGANTDPAWGGGGVRNDGTLTLSNCVVTANSAALGAGISNTVGAAPTLNQCAVSNNTTTASTTGAGLLNNGTAAITNSTFSGNTAVGNASAGGVGAAVFNGFLGSLTATGSTIAQNQTTDPDSAGGAQGAIHSDGLASFLSDTISANTAGAPCGTGVTSNSPRMGKWVAHVAVPDGSLWRSAADGSQRLQLTSRSFQAAMPHWSPDGKQIGFFGAQEWNHDRIYIVSVDGSALRRVTNGEGGELGD